MQRIARRVLTLHNNGIRAIKISDVTEGSACEIIVARAVGSSC